MSSPGSRIDIKESSEEPDSGIEWKHNHLPVT